MDHDRIGRAEDYTFAFLCMSYLLIVSALILVWGALGYLLALACCAGLHWAIARFGLIRARREAAWDARVAAAIARARR